MDQIKLIDKYKKKGPRYTSYPPIPFWNKITDQTKWLKHINEGMQKNNNIDLYIHIPFCESLCYYCGCHRTITKNHDVEVPLLNSIIKEWSLYLANFKQTPQINSLHLGGGTPTFLSPINLNHLLQSFEPYKSKTFVGSIEIDPRTCQREHLEVLKKFGFKRLSLGIQDFDSNVQKSINRYQDSKLVRLIVEQARSMGFDSINFDLIYGLPKQSLKSIEDTIEEVIKLNPDQIAFYSFAHLPDKIKNQKLIKSEDLPNPELKRMIYDHGKELLERNGFIEIGMDHFAKKDSYLANALIQKKLHRNFMGYTDKKTELLIGLGPSSISDSSKSFRQNEKNFSEYQNQVNLGILPHSHGHEHSMTDVKTQQIILDLLCHQKANLEELSSLPYSEKIMKEIEEFQNDGLVSFESDQLHISSLGKIFSRNIAMSFDSYLREQTEKELFSSTI